MTLALFMRTCNNRPSFLKINILSFLKTYNIISFLKIFILRFLKLFTSFFKELFMLNILVTIQVLYLSLWIDISIICAFFMTWFNLFNLDGYFKSNILLFFLAIYTFFFLYLIDFIFVFELIDYLFWKLIYFHFWKLIISFPFWKYLYLDF